MPSPDEEVDETPAAPLPDEAEPTASEEPAKPRVVRMVAKAAARNDPLDPLPQCKERLAFVRTRIAALRQYEKEERRLAKMLAALDDEDMAAE